MILSITGKKEAPTDSPVVLRGDYGRIISAAAAIGYEAVELYINDAAEIDWREMRRLLEASNIGLSSIATGYAYHRERLFLASENPVVRQAAVRCLEGHIAAAADFGAVVVIGLIKGLVRDCSSREAYLKHLGESLSDLVKTAEKSKVTLVLEVIDRYESDILNTIDEGVEFIQAYDSERLLLHIDTFHMNMEEARIGDSIRRARGKIGHCHIADNDRWYAGHGHYDFGETIQALKDIGYDRALSLESFMYPEPEVAAAETLRTLRKYL